MPSCVRVQRWIAIRWFSLSSYYESEAEV